MNDSAWNYCVREYARPGMAGALLRAQDEQGLDVVLHLFAQYAQSQLGVALDSAALEDAAAAIAPWREAAVLPLRAVRRRLKPIATSEAAVHVLRERVKAAELDAERIQLELLCAWLSERLARLPAVKA